MPKWAGVDPGDYSSWTISRRHVTEAQHWHAALVHQVAEDIVTGGMGEVFRPGFIIGSVSVGRDHIEEVRDASAFYRPGVVTIPARDETDDDITDIIVMEFLSGTSVSLGAATEFPSAALADEPYMMTQPAAEHADRLGVAEWIEPIVSLVRQSVSVQQVCVDLSLDAEDASLSTLVIKLALQGTAGEVVQAEETVNDALFDMIPANIRLHFAFDYDLIG